MEKADDKQQVNQGLVVVVGRVRLFTTPWAIAHRAPLSMGFSRQEHWSGWPFLLQVILLTQGLNSRLLHYRWIFRHLSLQGSPNKCLCTCKFFKAGARGAKHNERESGRKEGEKKERKKGRAGGRQEKARKGGEIKKQRRGWILQLLHTPKSIPPTAIF